MREVTDAVCATFGICNPNLYHLWIPTGIQLIIEKYGGKPVSGGRLVALVMKSVIQWDPTIVDTLGTW